MADHTVTIRPGYVLEPPRIGGPPNKIYKGDVVHFDNHEGDACILNFGSSRPFGQPTIGPIANGSSASPPVTVNVLTQQSFDYTCGPATATSAVSGSPSSTSSVRAPSDPGEGVIIVDPPGGVTPSATVTTTAAKPAAKSKPAKKPKKAAGKAKSSKSKTRTKAKPKSKGKGKGKAKAKSKSKARAKKKH